MACHTSERYGGGRKKLPKGVAVNLDPRTNGMLSSVSARLDRVDKQPVGVTYIDVQAYMQHLTGTTRVGVTADISKRFTGSLSGFASGQFGLSRNSGTTSMEAIAKAGLRGYF